MYNPISGVPLRRVGGVIAAAAIAVVGLAAPAIAKPNTAPNTAPSAVPGGFADWSQLLSYQDKLHTAAGGILAGHAAGFAGAVAAADQHRLDLYWKGAVPSAARTLAARSGVPVAFHQAPYSQAELVAEAGRLAADPRVAMVAPKADGSGLAVTVTSARPQAGRVDLLASARMPLSVTTGPRPHAMAGRQADTPAFWGGSRFNVTGGGFCSNGFAATTPGHPNVTMMTAAHCGANGDAITIPGQPAGNGVLFGDNNPRDTVGAVYPSGVAGLIYRGAFNSTSSAAVAGAAADIVGDFVCTGGSASGEHCNLRVQAVDQSVTLENGLTIGPETLATAPAGQCAVAPGDSGGPVFSTRTDGKVTVRGTISAGQLGTATCPGLSPNGSSLVLYAPALRPAGDPQIGSLQFYGATAITG